MPINAGYEYEQAEKKFLEAEGVSEKLKCLQEMLKVAPSHKGSERLRNEIKQRIKRYKEIVAKEKQKKGGRRSLAIKKEGAAQVVIIGKTNVGKSTLLSKLTNAKPLIREYPFTTKKPEVAVMDYEGVKVQLIEMPAITNDFIDTDLGPTYLSIIREADLVVALVKKGELDFIKRELLEGGVVFNGLVVDVDDEVSSIKENIWGKLNLIYVFTKSPGKKKDWPPIALKKKSRVKDLALEVHKDFFKKLKYARVWGKSAKFPAMTVGGNHKLESGDVVEFHIK